MAQQEDTINIDGHEYIMKTYYMGFLKAGPNRSQDSTEAAEIQKKHLSHIQKMHDSGKLVAAGPFLDDGDIRGILIFHTETIEEAREMAEQDPAVKAGRLILELHPWYAAKGTTLP